MSTVETKTGRSTWTIDASHTLVEFAVKHMMIATVKGRFGDVTGTIVLDEGAIENSSVEAEIDVASIDTRNADRDAHLRSADFFDVENHPKMTFKSRRVEPQGAGRFRVVGDLTIRGTTREVVLDVEDQGRGKDPWGGERAAFSATTEIDRTDFGLTWNAALETGGVLVSDRVRISLEVEAVKAQDQAAS
ncbi:MAG: YceI family protein [Gemmatimonadota bacterium]|jgi:polyisoprenoid-binding protein YceI